MGCVIVGIIILAIGGVAMAFGVSVWGALLILLGLLIAVGILAAVNETVMAKKGKNIIPWVAAVLLVVFCIFVLVRCFGFISENAADDGSWDKCMKCGGDGKWTNDMGFRVTCPRCEGVGYLP